MVKKLVFIISYILLVGDFYFSVPPLYSNVRLLALFVFLLPIPYLLKLFWPNFENKLVDSWKSVSTSFYSVFVLIFIFNLTVIIFPSVARSMPPTIINFYQLENLVKVRAQTVEYIDDNPFVKFRPNVVARSQGLRGDTTEFQYTWKTDDWGFKNNSSKSKADCDVIFLGNSFTEGMGVSTMETLPSHYERMSEESTYNLGVQGYAPTQMLGTFELYADELNPKKVYLVYYSTIFEREEKFLDLEEAKRTKKFTGGIANISEEENEREIKASSQSRRIFTSIIVSAYVYLRTMKDKSSEEDDSQNKLSIDLAKHPFIEAYRAEIEEGTNNYMTGLIDDVENESEAWKNTLNVIKKLKILCEREGRDFALVYIPRRASVYYKAITNDVDTRFIDDVEIDAFATFCKSDSISFINSTSDVIKYTQDVLPKNDYELLPYLKIDRHMNENGYKVVAQSIINYNKK